jgi:hypothetical protein
VRGWRRGRCARRLAPLLALAAAGACGSTAPYTIPSALINTAFAAGASLERRNSGACFVPCAYGTACNPRTGYCERNPAPPACAEGDPGDLRCAPLAMPVVSERKDSEPGAAPPLGVSPATGAAQPPPAKASPEAP